MFLGAGGYEIDIRTNYPLLPTVWTFEMQRPDKKPFTFTATITIYENEDIHDFEVKTYKSIPIKVNNEIQIWRKEFFEYRCSLQVQNPGPPGTLCD